MGGKFEEEGRRKRPSEEGWGGTPVQIYVRARDRDLGGLADLNWELRQDFGGEVIRSRWVRGSPAHESK